MWVLYKNSPTDKKINKPSFCMLHHLQPDLEVGLQQNCPAILPEAEKVERATAVHDDQCR